MTTFFGFAVADSMFSGSIMIARRSMTVEEVQSWLAARTITPCLNPSHAATIAAMRERFDLDVAIPATPPQVSLKHGDSLIVMGVRGLPRLTDRHEYSSEEVAKATFSFSLYSVRDNPDFGE